jgi:uncharacterized protein YkwD
MARNLTILAILILPAQWAAADEKLQLTKEEQEVVDLTNKERKAADLPPLKVNEKLVKAARAHSANMAKQEKLDHTLDDKGPAERLKDIGYAFNLWAENVAEGQRTAAEVMSSWMDSEMHKANILSKNVEIGVGVAKSADGKKYWTQVFGSPAK